MNTDNDSSAGTISAVTGTGPAEPSPAELQAQLDALRESHEAFRTLARDRAIRGFRDGEWDLSSLNDTLHRLELQPYEPTHVSRAIATIELQLEADVADTYRAQDAMWKLTEPDALRALREAIANVVHEHVTGDPAVTVTDRDLTAYIGHTSSHML